MIEWALHGNVDLRGKFLPEAERQDSDGRVNVHGRTSN